MANGHYETALRQMRRLFLGGVLSGMTDDQLLDRFASRRDAAAFEALVARHGPMVLAVCRGVLRDQADAEDAFQATFLVLVRKAGSLRVDGSLGSWLYRVAYRIAIRANALGAQRRIRETRGGVQVQSLRTQDGAPEPDIGPVVHEEVNNLPDKLRAPVVLCYLEGLTYEEAAARLCWPVGTVAGRMARARELLRARLTRRGVAFSGGLLTTVLGREATAAVPSVWIDSAVKVAIGIAESRTIAAGVVSTSAIALSEGVLRTMLLPKIAAAIAIVVALNATVWLTASIISGRAASAAREGIPTASSPRIKEHTAGKRAVNGPAVATVSFAPVEKPAPLDPFLEEAEPEDEAIAEARRMARALRLYRIGRQERQPVELRPVPLQRWDEPVRGLRDCSIWVWGSTGRPVAALAFELFTTRQSKPSWGHEFISLSASPLEVEGPAFDVSSGGLRPGQSETTRLWTPMPALEFHDFPGATVPEPNATARLRRMSDLAARFSGLQFPDSVRPVPLQTLPVPSLRYEDAANDVVDGALFLLAEAGNPEILILIEAQGKSQDPGEATWRYALIQATCAPFTVTLDQDEVWTQAYTPETRSDDPYFIAGRSRDTSQTSRPRTPRRGIAPHTK